ncbi:glycosyltransferase family 4 protein [Bacteroides gallinaceum]|uniref:glycosyltransferase family 4 protein n=1 Tax=Bacteroides gallinaceum TaxID=1462571 RepID=UPI00195CECB7|nr:glycosyltransferase family 4 protein [Bacteroides gallinaceum]MBM6720191.1 glycosyltransferase family 4 protein [Bacteroides gallinaceum]
MKIIYCIAGTCHSGGMERVLANKANYLTGHGYEVVIVTTDQQGLPPFFPLAEQIRCIDLGINYEENNGKSFANKLLHYPLKQYRHQKRLAAILKREKPDITVSMFCNDAGFITRINDGSKKVLEIHFSKFKRLQYNRKGLWRLADLWRSRQDERTVRRFDKFVVLTEEDKGYWGNLPNITVIPNANTFATSQAAALENKKVIAIGRYTYQKGFERLIEAWNILSPGFPGWKLDIIGNGEERDKLQDLIHAYHLDGQVTLVSPTKSIDKVYLDASVLVMSSRYEGLPMVLLEAQAFGLPIVSFACKCGPKDIVANGETGFLVEENDIEGLARQLVKVMKDKNLRKQMGRKAKEASLRYAEDAVMAKWTALFDSLKG